MEPSLSLGSLQAKRRAEAEIFLNEIGAERVVGIVESGYESEFAVVVWYRDDERGA